MTGAQALIAFNNSKSCRSTKGMIADYSGGILGILAMVKLLENRATAVNNVQQMKRRAELVKTRRTGRGLRGVNWRRFAADYVASSTEDDPLRKMCGDAQMQLYGLHKVAMDVPNGIQPRVQLPYVLKTEIASYLMSKGLHT